MLPWGINLRKDLILEWVSPPNSVLRLNGLCSDIDTSISDSGVT